MSIPTLPGFSRLPPKRHPGHSKKKLQRDWWHELLRKAGKYPCYGIFLANTPKDKETEKYLKEYRVELDRFSGEYCLIVILGDRDVQISGLDGNVWKEMVEIQLGEGNSVIIADLFNIMYDDFPCLLLFEDIRDAKHIIVTLKDMTADEISSKMQTVLSITRQAVNEKESPLVALERNRFQGLLLHNGKVIISGIIDLTKIGFETAMKTWVKTNLMT